MFDKLRQKVASAIYKDRQTEHWERLRKEAGFIPLSNKTDVASRIEAMRQTIIETNIFDPAQQKNVVQKVYAMFFSVGDPWYRGLDNRELAEKVKCFLENYSECGYMEEFIPDLFEESMQLLSLSFQAIDVTNTPWYIVESKPVVIPNLKGTPDTETDESGTIALQQEIAEIREKLREQKE